MFQADTTERVLVARARGGNDQPVYAHETLDEAADLTEIVNHGRLSEAELKSTFAHLDGDRLSIDGDPLGPATVGITVDTSVGTRVFMGDVMVYGDTGWRDITSTATDALDPSNTGTIQLKREGNTVSLALRNVSLLPGDGPLVIGPLWQSFWPTTNRFLSSVASVSGASFQANEFIVLNQYAWIARRQLDTGEVSQTRTTDPISGVRTYTTPHLGPSALPVPPACREDRSPFNP